MTKTYKRGKKTYGYVKDIGASFTMTEIGRARKRATKHGKDKPRKRKRKW